MAKGNTPPNGPSKTALLRNSLELNLKPTI